MSGHARGAVGASRRRSGGARGGASLGRVAAAAVVAGLAAVSPPAGARGAEPSAAEIVARSVDARGGLDAWRKVETMIWAGHVESAHAPVPGIQFTLEQKRPNRTRLQLNALGDRTVRIFDGARGWKVRPGHGRPDVRPYSSEEARFAAGRGIDGPLIDSAARGSVVTLEGLDEIGGRKAHHLKVRPAAGGEEHVWVDAETFLEVRHDRVAGGPGGASRRVSTTYGDYRTVEGLRIPFLIETGGGPGTPDRMRIETVIVNAPLDDAIFANPAASRLRDRAWGSAGLRGHARAAARGRAAGAAPAAPPAAASAERGSSSP